MQMLEAQWLKTIDFTTAWEHQKSLREQVLLGGRTTILGCEHEPVLTLGKRAIERTGSNNHKLQIPTVLTDRGGLATLHNPGQLVIYPILHLREYGFGVREWVELLLETTSASLKKCNIIVIGQNSGIFTKFGKIASVGININKGVSTHGIAINVCNDLSLFDHFSPCGVLHQKMDKVENHASDVTTEALFHLWTNTLRERLTHLN